MIGVLSLCSNARATATTHIWAPSTDVQAFNVWHVTADMYLAVRNDAAGNRIPAITNIGLTVGILPMKRLNLEIGIDHKSGLGAIDGYPLYGNVKMGIPENAFGGVSPAAAVGVFDIGTKKDRTDFDVVYAKIAKTFSMGARLSAGCPAATSPETGNFL